CSKGECTFFRSFFLEFLQKRLDKAAAGDTLAELVAAVRKDIVDEAAKNEGIFAFKQHPQLLGGLSPDWLLVDREPAAPPKKMALVARAYDNRKDRIVAMAVEMCSGADRRLVKALGRLGWDVTFLESRPKIEVPPPAETVPTEANLRGYLKELSKQGN